MIQQNISLFSLSIRIAQFLGSILLHWNPQTQKIYLFPNHAKQHQKLKRKLEIHATLLVILAIQGILTLLPSKLSKSYNFTDKIVYGIGLVLLFSSHLEQQVCRILAKLICTYVNGILQFQTKCPNIPGTSPLSLIEKLNLCFAYGFYPTALSLPVAFVYGLHWINPCKSSLIGYWLIPECSLYWNTDKWIWSFSAKIMIFLINHWVWSFSLYSSAFVASGIQILCTLSLRGFIKIFERLAHSNNNHSFGIGVVYRTIQILTCLANEIQQKVFTSIVIISGTIMISFCTTTVVWLPWTSENVLSLLLFSIIGIESYLIVVTSVGGMCGVYTESVKVTKKFQKSFGVIGGSGCRNLTKVGRGYAERLIEVKWKQRFYTSCSSIKIRFASINFVDRLTPLACVDFANGLTLQWLLLGK